MSKWVGIKEFAEILGCSREWARELVRQGKAPRHYKMGRAIRFDMKDIETWMAAHVVNPENK